MHNEMPGFFPGRPGGEHDEPLLDTILERRPIPPGAPPEIHGLARMLAAVAGPAEPGDLPGQAAALAAFARLGSPPGTSPAALRSARRSLSERPARGRLRLAVALAAAAAGLGSTVAAYADVLPSPIQHFAHVAFGAPAPPRNLTLHAPAATGSPARRHPDVGLPAAKKHSATSSDPDSDKTHPGRLHSHGGKGYGAASGLASCPPTHDQGQDHGQGVGHSKKAPNQVQAGSSQWPGGSGLPGNTASPGSVPAGWPALPAVATACPGGTIATKAAHAPGQ
jgi:hypothetical protein